MKNYPLKKILLLRPDRLGDVMLTLPALGALKKKYPDSQFYFLVNKNLAPLLLNHPDLSGVLEMTSGEKSGELARKIKPHRFDCAIHFFLKKETVLATFLSGIPLRIGPASKIWALFLNKRVTQHRSRSEKNEAQYNLDLVSCLGIDLFPERAAAPVTHEERIDLLSFLREEGLKSGTFVLIHPGGAKQGKALSPRHFKELAWELKKRNIPVAVSIGPDEERLKDQFRDFLIVEHLPLRVFAAFLSHPAVFVTNSTGPLHLAVSLDTPTVSFFGKSRGVSPLRWGPWPPSLKHKTFFTDEFSLETTLQAIASFLP